MKQKDKLFELIKVLKDGEKQWVLKCFKAFKQKNNLILFKYLNEQSSYNKNHLISSLRKAPFINYLAVQKNSLYNSILKFLKSYTDDLGETELLKNNIADFTYLEDRLLNLNHNDEISSLKNQVIDQQEHNLLLHLLNLEMDAASENSENQSLSHIDKIYNQYSNHLDLLKEIWDYKYLITKINAIRSNAIVIPEEEQDKLLNDVKTMLENKNIPENLVTRYYYNQINLLYRLHLEDFVQAYEISESQIQYFDKFDIPSYKFQKEKAITFVNSLALSFFADADELRIDDIIQKTHVLLKKDIFVPFHNVLYNKLYYNQLNHYNFRDFDVRRESLVNEILIKSENKSLIISPDLSLSMAHYFFSIKNYDSAIVWNNNTINTPKKEAHPAVQYNAMVLKMLIHIERGDVFYLKSILGSLKRFIEKEEFDNDFNRSLYLFFKKYEHELLSAFPDTKRLCRQFYDLLITQKFDAKKNLRFVNISGWIKKIQL